MVTREVARRQARYNELQRNRNPAGGNPSGEHNTSSPNIAVPRAPPVRGSGEPQQPGGHSALDPRLPIPNRTVKRRRADDSADYPCESRSPPGTPIKQSPPREGFVVCTLNKTG